MDQIKRFSATNAEYLKKMGSPPPAAVFECHPAFEPLSEAIRRATWRKFRGARRFHAAWCDEASRYVLQSLAKDGDKLTEGGVNADEMAEDLAHHTFAAGGPNAAVSRVVFAFLDDTPPANSGPLLDAWLSVRGCPAPDLEDWSYEDEVRARFNQLKARRGGENHD